MPMGESSPSAFASSLRAVALTAGILASPSLAITPPPLPQELSNHHMTVQKPALKGASADAPIFNELNVAEVLLHTYEKLEPTIPYENLDPNYSRPLGVQILCHHKNNALLRIPSGNGPFVRTGNRRELDTVFRFEQYLVDLGRKVNVLIEMDPHDFRREPSPDNIRNVRYWTSGIGIEGGIDYRGESLEEKPFNLQVSNEKLKHASRCNP